MEFLLMDHQRKFMYLLKCIFNVLACNMYFYMLSTLYYHGKTHKLNDFFAGRTNIISGFLQPFSVRVIIHQQ